MGEALQGVGLLTIFVLSAFTGYEVISKVSTILHTPLMSGANAIHGVILVGAVMVAGQAKGALELGVALVAVALATLNLVGGFVVTDRMLMMFDKRKRPAANRPEKRPAPKPADKKRDSRGRGSAPAKKATGNV